jgi:hypothetical protein
MACMRVDTPIKERLTYFKGYTNHNPFQIYL